MMCVWVLDSFDGSVAEIFGTAVPGIVIRPAAWDLFSSASITNIWSQAHVVVVGL